MTRPRVIDTFMFGRELDVLELRLRTMYDAVDHFVIVEATTDHQGHEKPLYYWNNTERFDAYADKIEHVVLATLPSVAEAPDAWAREHAQREGVRHGLVRLGYRPDDVILHGDCDEIVHPVVARNLRPLGMVSVDMPLYCFAVDWKHPDRWRGTVAAQAKNIRTFTAMRDSRNFAPAVTGDAGWHFSWLGGADENVAKLDSFCHPEIAQRTRWGLENDIFLRDGFHVDGKKLVPVEVDRSWPAWIAKRECPSTWFRQP